MEQDPEKPHSVAKEIEHDAIYAEKATAADLRAGAIEAENEEHNMTVLQAVRAYPMAAFWAFVMSSCIVSCLFSFFFPFFFLPFGRRIHNRTELTVVIADHGVLRCVPHW